MPTSVFTVVGDVRLHHLDHGGEGPPIVLVHGALGSAWMWDSVAPALRPHGRVLALDMRGYGDSQWDPSQGYSTEGHQRDLVGWLEKLGLSQARFVGFSWGALAGLHLARTRPDLVERLAMIEVMPSFDRGETEIPDVQMEFSDHAEALAAEQRQSSRASADLLETLARFQTRPGPGGKLVKKHDPVFAERWAFRGDDRWDELAALEQRLLVVRAPESPVTAAAQVERMVATAGSAELVEIEDSGHLIPIENPAALIPCLTEFLAG